MIMAASGLTGSFLQLLIFDGLRNRQVKPRPRSFRDTYLPWPMTR